MEVPTQILMTKRGKHGGPEHLARRGQSVAMEGILRKRLRLARSAKPFESLRQGSLSAKTIARTELARSREFGGRDFFGVWIDSRARHHQRPAIERNLHRR